VTAITGFVPSAARTTSGNSGTASVQVPANVDTVSVLANVTAASGTTPSLVLSVQWSNDGTTWATADPPDTFTAITAAGVVVKAFPVRAAVIRLAWTITGTTPSFTFSADARWADRAL
jgi:hypothetical protein